MNISSISSHNNNNNNDASHSHSQSFIDEGGTSLSSLIENVTNIRAESELLHSPSVDVWWSQVFDILKAFILISIIVVAMFSNSLVVISVIRYQKLRHINNYFLVSLAFADLFVAAFAMTFNATVVITGKWNFGLFICDLWNSLDVYFSTVSTLNLCCIAIDRYYAIVKPLKYASRMDVFVASLLIGLAWILPIFISFVPIFLGWYTTSAHLKWRVKNSNVCVFKVNKPYALISSALTFWGPVLVMLILYYRVFKEALRQKEAIRRSSVPVQQFYSTAVAGGATSKVSMNPKGISALCAPLKSMPATTFSRQNTDNCFSKECDLQNSSSPNSNEVSFKKSNISQNTNNEIENSNIYVNNLDPKFVMEVRKPSNSMSITSSTQQQTESPIGSNSNSMFLDTRCGVVEKDKGFLDSDNDELCQFPSSDLKMKESCDTKLNSIESGRKSRDQKSLDLLSNVSYSRRNSSSHIPAFRRVSTAVSIASEGFKERQRIHISWRKEHKALVTLGFVMGTFLICWTPFFTWYLTVTICGDYYCPCPDAVVSFLFWIGYFNSTLNPVIYVMTNRDFKYAFTDILRGMCRFVMCYTISPARLDSNNTDHGGEERRYCGCCCIFHKILKIDIKGRSRHNLKSGSSIASQSTALSSDSALVGDSKKTQNSLESYEIDTALPKTSSQNQSRLFPEDCSSTFTSDHVVTGENRNKQNITGILKFRTKNHMSRANGEIVTGCCQTGDEVPKRRATIFLKDDENNGDQTKK